MSRQTSATNLESLVVASSEDTARELKEQHSLTKEQHSLTRSLEMKVERLQATVELLVQAQGIPAERLPLRVDDLSA